MERCAPLGKSGFYMARFIFSLLLLPRTGSCETSRVSCLPGRSTAQLVSTGVEQGEWQHRSARWELGDLYTGVPMFNSSLGHIDLPEWFNLRSLDFLIFTMGKINTHTLRISGRMKGNKVWVLPSSKKVNKTVVLPSFFFPPHLLLFLLLHLFSHLIIKL